MFPIPWNFPLRKKNGNLVNIGDAIDAGTEIPEHGVGDAGKVLSVDENGDLEWSDDVNSEIQTLTNQLNGNWSEGGKNLLPNTAITETVSGVTFTKNSDGTITANGTATANIYFVIGTVSNLIGSFVLNGCPTGGGGSTYRLYAYVSGGGSTIASDYGAGDSFTLAESTNIDAAILLLNGQTVSNIVFKPMIRKASIADATYQPYAMTNRELTEVIDSYSITSLKNVSVDGVGLLFSKVGNMVTLAFSGTSTENITENTDFYELTGALKNAIHLDTLLIGGQRMQLDLSHHSIRFSAAIPSGTALRGTILYVADNFDVLT